MAKPWTMKEIKIVMEEYPTCNLDQLAQRIGRSKCSIISKANHCGVVRDPKRQERNFGKDAPAPHGKGRTVQVIHKGKNVQAELINDSYERVVTICLNGVNMVARKVKKQLVTIPVVAATRNYHRFIE